ncbi:hypothetical protein EYF80_038811 [Liparis tanakae]|uniref:Uncharacterized protein n=1 Tax=Liparis tanakae TaxID=230148 RepID=A0A4Z2GCA6_9TELE|nr:hypothetical protein EYF80_038811 [Liparis tanakae]
MSSITVPFMMQLRSSNRLCRDRLIFIITTDKSVQSDTDSIYKESQARAAVYLAVSFHSASSPSRRQISSSSVNRAWGMCSSSPSSVPSRNCTL